MRCAYDYDAMGRMIRKSASGRTLLALEYGWNGNKVRQIDVTGKLTSFDYDCMGCHSPSPTAPSDRSMPTIWTRT